MSEFQSDIVLKMWVDPTVEGLKEIYKEHVAKHNLSVETERFPNSGFDLFIPQHMLVLPTTTTNYKSYMIPFGIKCEMTEGSLPSAYLLTPRSSMSNVPLIQSNHIGLIDCGYRGEIKAPVRSLIQDDYMIERHTRLFQLWHPSAKYFTVKLVENESDLSSTERGELGFGSSGIVGLRTT